jgi:coenzyme F420 biosynthesis associated uncharacterized protein
VTQELIDWDLAVATATRLVPTGPRVTREEAHQVVRELRVLADEAEGHVRSFTGLGTAMDHHPVAVVDRVGWVRSNIGGFRVLLAPLLQQLVQRRNEKREGDRDLLANPFISGVGSRLTGIEMGAVLAYLAGKVLGQYELFLPPGPSGSVQDGRLTLVAPNIVAIERALGADPRDFRLWVCVHEVTHRTQFTAVPWLQQHVRDEIGAFLLASDLDPSAMLGRLKDVAEAIVDTMRGGEGSSLLEAVQTPEQRVVLERLTAVMTLLEGHGEYVMNNVGHDVIPSVDAISASFAERRKASGPIDRAVRRLFGLDLKARQYAEGSAFVKTVVDRHGMAAFNRVWTSPNTLPTKAEIAEPEKWMARVLPTAELR